jgi:hypothetical protein
MLFIYLLLCILKIISIFLIIVIILEDIFHIDASFLKYPNIINLKIFFFIL